jgi:hypothetical protein
MGRKSKRRGGKSKRGGNQRPSPCNNAEKIPDDLIQMMQITKAFGTLMLAEMGHVEDEKDSSIVYAEENAGELFVDGGETFFRRLKEATDKVKLKEEKRNEMNDGDTDDQAMDKVQNDLRIEQGSPPIPPESDAFHNTIVDDELFQPRPPRPDCPICFLPLPARNECCYQPCCGKVRR